MKLYLIAVLFLATLVVVPCLAEEQTDTAATVADAPEADSSAQDPPGQTGDEQAIEKVADPPGQTGDEQAIEKIADTPVEEAEDEEQEEEDEDEEKIEVPKELQDEVEEVRKRRVPQLSRKSCLILKRYGYCRNKAIARFCLAACQCAVPDRLSALSCRRVKYNYRACHHAIGRVYCRRTCGHCKKFPPPQCRRYRSINDITRRQSRPRGNVLKCDSKIALGWYRFVGYTGTYIPNRVVPSNRCGTHATSWVVGSYPNVRGQTVTRQVCFRWSNNNCYNSRWWKVYIKITNCGNFNVFYLTRPKACYYRYCGNL